MKPGSRSWCFVPGSWCEFLVPGAHRARRTGHAHEEPRTGNRERVRRLAFACGLVLAAGVALDASRAPERQLTAALAIRSVHAYQRTLSPMLDRCGLHCRFTPTCSHYAEAALRTHGIAGGTWLALKRVVRCGPWTPAGMIDAPE